MRNSNPFDGITYGSIPPPEDCSPSGSGVSSSKGSCSQLESASNLIAVVTGAGMLSLPFAAASMGWSAMVLLAVITACFVYSYVLLALSIEYILLRRGNEYDIVDYVVLGKEAFGSGGDKIVLVILISELFLALVSFFINIGININAINHGFGIPEAIVLSSVIAAVLACLDMKVISRFTAGGNIMTGLTIASLALSGAFLPADGSTEVHYKGLDIRGLPLSLGVMAYCFGGHGAFPKIYQSMAERHRYPVAISTVAAVVFSLYAVIISIGYAYYGSHTKIPVTINIGRDLQGMELPNARLLSIFASLGLICNIQATCPIIVLTIGDMYTTALGREHSNGRYVSLIVILFAMLIAVFLREDFLQVCGIVGSFSTITSSIFLPIIFYHQLFKYAEIPKTTYAIHIAVVCLAACAMFVGVTSSVCGITGSESALCTLTQPSND